MDWKKPINLTDRSTKAPLSNGIIEEKLEDKKKILFNTI